MCKYFCLVFLSCVIFLARLDANELKKITLQSVKDVLKKYPNKIKILFKQINLDFKGLSKVKEAVGRNDLENACTELLEYYKTSNGTSWLRQKKGVVYKKRPKLQLAADLILNDTFRFQDITGKQPRNKNGYLNWKDSGPKRDLEWAFFLNRHHWLYTLLRTYRSTNDIKYVKAINSFISDWIISNPYPNKKTGDATWRGLEVSARIQVWAKIFYGLIDTKVLSPATKILMLTTVCNHANTGQKFHGGGNWLLIEMNGLATAGISWPEFKNADEWFNYSLKKIQPQIQKQVISDGVHYEMSANYHLVAINTFYPITKLAKKANRTMSKEYSKGIENLHTYLAYSVRPNGFIPLTADSDSKNIFNFLKNRARVFNRDDWIYIATHGVSGTKPSHTSYVWPYSGQFVMRNNYKKDSHWLYFDTGPCGGWHGHFDNLHFSIHAYGRDLLVDGGRYWYKGDAWRKYFKSSFAHNVILVDGQGQKDSGGGTKLFNHHRIHPAFDYVKGIHHSGYNKNIPAKHQRAIVYLKNKCWIVFDHVSVIKKRKIETLWHFSPDCTVKKKDNNSSVSIDKEKGNLAIIPIGNPGWAVSHIKGQTKPTIQGWYSPTYNVKHKNTAAIYSKEIKKNSSFVWALIPGKGDIPSFQTKLLSSPEGSSRVEITYPGGEKVEVAVRFNQKITVPLNGGKQLQGDCAIIGLQKKDLVVGGKINDKNGKTIVSHQYSPKK